MKSSRPPFYFVPCEIAYCDPCFSIVSRKEREREKAKQEEKKTDAKTHIGPC